MALRYEIVKDRHPEAQPPLTDKPCPHRPVSCAFRCYPRDGECPCGIWKHHVHGTCGGFTQIG